MKKETKNHIDKVNIKDKKILIFEKIGNTDYYKPINEKALNYLKTKYKEYQEEALYDLEYREFDKKELTKQKYDINLVGKFLDNLKIETKGLKKVTNTLPVYLNTRGEPTPINENSEEKQEEIIKLVLQPATEIKDIWLKIDSSFKKDFELIE